MRRIAGGELFENFDWPLLGCTLSILGIGILNLYSATYNLPVARYVSAQSIWVGAGVLIALMLTFFDYRIFERIAYPIYGIVIALLIYVLLAGRFAAGAQRWIQLGPISLQPSELAKVAVIIALSRYFYGRKVNQPLGLISLFWPMMLAFVPFVLILKQPDLGTALVVAGTAGWMILFVGVRRKVIISLAIVGLVMAPLAWSFVLRPYQKERIYTFLRPERAPLDQGYQIIQSKIAIGSGEVVGKGFLKGSQSKLQFLPKQHTDFVFSNFAEEFGFLGSVILLGLYASFSFLGLTISYLARDRFGMMLALGLTGLVSLQAVINLGMEMGLLPVVGVTLPLFSYGGTSMLSTLAGVGILLNISKRRYMF